MGYVINAQDQPVWDKKSPVATLYGKKSQDDWHKISPCLLTPSTPARLVGQASSISPGASGFCYFRVLFGITAGHDWLSSWEPKKVPSCTSWSLVVRPLGMPRKNRQAG